MKLSSAFLSYLTLASLALPLSAEESMDKMWGDRSAKEGVEGSKRAELFRDGNYGMFIHWGLYSHLGGQWKGKTFYGIGLLGVCFLRDASERAIGADRRAGKWGLVLDGRDFWYWILVGLLGLEMGWAAWDAVCGGGWIGLLGCSKRGFRHC